MTGSDATGRGRAAWITGAGIVSALGAGRDAHLAALADPARIAAGRDSTTFAPWHAHPFASVDLDRFMPRRADQRAMGVYMQHGVHAAGLALEEAGVRGDPALLARTHLLAAASGGERDLALDEAVLGESLAADDPSTLIARRLTDGLRPTAFLAQLPNMFAGNISIVLDVAGSSRTFMGEEAAGVDALRMAWRRVEAGQGDLFLVAAAVNSARWDALLTYRSGGRLLEGPWRDLWDRPDAGVTGGSLAAALVIEAADHAATRGARPLARLDRVAQGWSDRSPGAAARSAGAAWPEEPVPLVMSAASGAGPATGEERAFLAALPDRPAVRGLAAAWGHGAEAAFPAAVALAAWSVATGFVPPPLADDGIEAPFAGSPARVAVTGWGARRGEGMALVSAP
ncbi:MAG: beta-ketoacyl-ACP synthase [Alphaproteobacteria bacterium]